MIYHIASRADWQSAQENGSYTADSLAAEGFIHCSNAEQVAGVAARFYAGQRGLVLLAINPQKLSSDLRYEPGSDKPDELFPHIYGPLNLEAVASVLDLEPDSAGKWTPPPV
ncbi:MAG: DUF952 domain-containing protein [Chloroflexota bacterium]